MTFDDERKRISQLVLSYLSKVIFHKLNFCIPCYNYFACLIAVKLKVYYPLRKKISNFIWLFLIFLFFLFWIFFLKGIVWNRYSSNTWVSTWGSPKFFKFGLCIEFRGSSCSQSYNANVSPSKGTTFSKNSAVYQNLSVLCIHHDPNNLKFFDATSLLCRIRLCCHLEPFFVTSRCFLRSSNRRYSRFAR